MGTDADWTDFVQRGHATKQHVFSVGATQNSRKTYL
jgi:hypothetical protein